MPLFGLFDDLSFPIEDNEDLDGEALVPMPSYQMQAGGAVDCSHLDKAEA